MYFLVGFNYQSSIAFGCTNCLLTIGDGKFPSETAIREIIIRDGDYSKDTSIVVLSVCEFTEEQYKQFKKK